MPTLALITVLYNSNPVLPDFISSISKQTYSDYKLYIVDNSANKITVNLIEELVAANKISSYKYVDSGSNVGVARGNNIGIEHAVKDGCSKLLFLNNDIVFEQNYLFENMVNLSTTSNMVAPKLFYFDSNLIWYAGGKISKIRSLGVHFGYRKPENGKYNNAQYVGYAATCFLLVNKEVISSIGVMDEKYFAYYDDVDFVYRATKNGFKLWYEPSLTIQHKESFSTGGDKSLFYIYYSNRNKIYFINKHYKGVIKYVALMYVFLSRTYFYLKFNKSQKEKMLQAIKDGFKM
jgi:GT2 family glycosyltransferase